jgi:hypothetical protein
MTGCGQTVSRSSQDAKVEAMMGEKLSILCLSSVTVRIG